MRVHTDVPGGRALLGLYVANGVTGVRDMDGDLARLRAFQRDVAAGSLPGPRMVVSGPYVAGQRVPLPHVLVRTPDDAVIAVDSLARLGVDFVKVHNGMPNPGVLPNDSLLHRFGDSLQALWRLMLPPTPSPVPPAVTAAGARLFEKRLALVKALHDAGVPMLAGAASRISCCSTPIR